MLWAGPKLCCTRRRLTISMDAVQADALFLVREFLKRKGLERALKTLDNELPEKPVRQSRAEVSKRLNMMSLLRQNKRGPNPYPTLLEVLAQALRNKRSRHRSRHSTIESPAHSESRRDVKCPSHTPTKERAFNFAPPNHPAPVASPVAHAPSKEKRRPQKDLVLIDVSEDEFEQAPVPTPSPLNRGRRSLSSTSLAALLHGNNASTTGSRTLRPSGVKLPPDEIQELLQLVLNGNQPAKSARLHFPSSFLCQGFSFFTDEEMKSRPASLACALAQLEGGPCGVLAVTQAFLLKHLLFNHKGGHTVDAQVLAASKQCRLNALQSGLAFMLCQAGGGTCEIIIREGGELFSVRASSQAAAEQILTQHWACYASGHSSYSGIVLFIFSLVKSRTPASILNDVGGSGGTLIGRHGYCTQELVNLALTGAAVSSVHDEVKAQEEEEEKNRRAVMGAMGTGIARRGEVGLLSIYEAHGYLNVGRNLKFPRLPIWVVFAESHYTVVFALCKRLGSLAPARMKQPFDMYYFDGLARQEQELRLTLTVNSAPGADLNPGTFDEEVPFLNACLRTRWGPRCVVDWNDVEPWL